MAVEWEYHRLNIHGRSEVQTLDELGAKGWELVTADYGVLYLKRPKTKTATHLTLKIQGATMATTFTVDDTTATATLQFTDDHGDATVGPVDSVTTLPLVPSVVSSDLSALTVGVGTPGAPGQFTYALTPVAVGVVDVSVAPLLNSDGSAVVDAAGAPFTLPDPVSVDVTPGTASGISLTASA